MMIVWTTVVVVVEVVVVAMGWGRGGHLHRYEVTQRPL